MIDIVKEYQLSDGVAPYNYTITADDDCVDFEPASGTTDDNGVLQVSFSFANEACLTGTTFTITGEDDNSCPVSDTFTVSNPCSSLTVSEIANPSLFKFSVGAFSSESSEFDFSWTFDNLRFSQFSLITNANNSTIILSLNTTDVVPSSSQIKAIVVDGNGCTVTKSLTFTPCIPQLNNLSFNLYPLIDSDTGIINSYRSGSQLLEAPGNCVGYNYDMSKAEISLPTGFSFTLSSTGQLILTYSGNPPSTSYTGAYTITSEEGVDSNSGIINIIINTPIDTDTIYAPDFTYTLDCSIVPGDVVEIPLEESLVVDDGAFVDWNSWQLVTNDSIDDPASESIVIGTNSSGRYVIKYTVPDPIVNDTFHWSICDTNNNCTQAISYTVSQCAVAPVAVDDTATVACGETVEIDILQNDDPKGSTLRPNTITITESPGNGNVIINSDGNANYTANELFSGTDTFKYTVKNSFNTTTNEATVTITVICTGADAEIALCNT